MRGEIPHSARAPRYPVKLDALPAHRQDRDRGCANACLIGVGAKEGSKKGWDGKTFKNASENKRAQRPGTRDKALQSAALGSALRYRFARSW